jgi:hypothetical protein
MRLEEESDRRKEDHSQRRETEETRIAVVEKGNSANFSSNDLDRHKAVYLQSPVDTVFLGSRCVCKLGEGRNAFLYLADAKGHNVERMPPYGPGDEGGEKGKGPG